MSKKESPEEQIEKLQKQLLFKKLEVLEKRFEVTDSMVKMKAAENRKAIAELAQQVIKTRMDLLDQREMLGKQALDRIQSSLAAHKFSIGSLFYSMLTSALVGVIGNFFVTLWFQPVTSDTIIGLIASGFLLVFVCGMFLIEFMRQTKKKDKESASDNEK